MAGRWRLIKALRLQCTRYWCARNRLGVLVAEFHEKFGVPVKHAGLEIHSADTPFKDAAVYFSMEEVTTNRTLLV